MNRNILAWIVASAFAVMVAVGCVPRDAKQNALDLGPTTYNPCGISSYINQISLNKFCHDIIGTTVGYADNIYPECYGELGASPDNVYSFTFPKAGYFYAYVYQTGVTDSPSVSVSAPTTQQVVYLQLQTSCGNVQNEPGAVKSKMATSQDSTGGLIVDCNWGYGSTGLETALMAGTYYLVIDSPTGGYPYDLFVASDLSDYCNEFELSKYPKFIRNVPQKQ